MWPKKLFTERGGAWRWAQIGLGSCAGLLVVGLIRHDSPGDIILDMAAAAAGVLVVALIWKD
jgi:hypothetical protein